MMWPRINPAMRSWARIHRHRDREHITLPASAELRGLGHLSCTAEPEMLPLDAVSLLGSIAALSVIQACAPIPEDCLALDTRNANGHSKIQIHEAGDYCLTQDLHARIELADRPAEVALIQILGSGVRLDLGGHTLGRGRVFRNPGGAGIEIAPRATDIVISNGLLRDFDAGVFVHPGTLPPPIHDPDTDSFVLTSRNIVLTNLRFLRNDRDVQ